MRETMQEGADMRSTRTALRAYVSTDAHEMNTIDKMKEWGI